MSLNMTDLFLMLNSPENNIILLTVFWAVCAAALLLRLLVCAGYQARIVSFNLHAKDVASRSDIKDTGCGILNKVVKEYIKTAEKGVSNIDTSAIASKHVRRLHIMGWSYDSIEAFLSTFAQGMAVIGILFAVVFNDYQAAYGVSAAAAYILLRFMECIMDMRLARLRLTELLEEYVSREIGQFYAGDLGSVVLRLKNDLSASFIHQSETVLKYIDKMDGIMKTLEAHNALHGEANRAINEQLVYIGKNQQTLEQSIGAYEQSLENITQKMGGAFGGMAEYHIQEALRAVNEKMQDNIKQIATSNGDTLAKLTQLFENMQEQSRSETQAIIRVTEQLEQEIERAR